MWIVSGPVKTIKRTIGTGGLAAGSIVVMSSATAVKGAAAPTDATICGISTDTYVATDVGVLYGITSETVIGAKYTGSSKTSLTDADLGKVFDLSSDVLVNLDDTTGGCCVCEGYDNDNKYIYFKVLATKRVV